MSTNATIPDGGFSSPLEKQLWVLQTRMAEIKSTFVQLLEEQRKQTRVLESLLAATAPRVEAPATSDHTKRKGGK